MKKRRRKKRQKAEVRIPFPMVLANVLVVVAVAGLSYVWLCANCDSLGRKIKSLETVRRAERVRLINEQDCWSNMLTPRNLDRALKRHKLAMTLPGERRIVRVRGDGVSSVLTFAYNGRGRME